MSTYENYQPDVTQRVPASRILPNPTTAYQPRTFSPVDLPQDELARQNYIAKTEHLYDQFKNQPRVNLVTHPSYYNQQVGKAVEMLPDQRYVSNNQKLVGGANPKTMIKPVVAPPAYEWTYWKANDFVLPPQINTRSVQDYYASGYYVDEPPVAINEEMQKQVKSSPLPQRKMVENYEQEAVHPSGYSNQFFRSDQKSTGVYNPCAKSSCAYEYNEVTPLQRDNGDFEHMSRRKQSVKTTGDLNDVMGYDSTNLEYNLPSNYPASNCQRTDKMKSLNEQVWTSTIVPGVYYQSQIIEPISSNIGISFDQQIPPRKVSKDQYGNVIYQAMDPREYEPDEPVAPKYNVPSNFDVYDPRYDGYGTADRSYTDKLTGQPRFYYDDVDAIRRPNYVTRSNIDFLCNADTYGPTVGADVEIDRNERIRIAADQSYTDNTLDFRTDMMTRLMRKRNAELWQTRMAPKTTMKK